MESTLHRMRRQGMRKVLTCGFVAACLAVAPMSAVAGSFNANGQFVGTVSPQVTAVLALLPAGLRAAVAFLLETNPTLADDVVFAARVLDAARKPPVGAGIADAANFFALCAAGTTTETCRTGESYLRYAMLFADPIVLANYEQTVSAAFNTIPLQLTPLPIEGIGGGNCVSPTKAHGC